MEDWLKDAIEKVAGEAEMAIWSCKQLAKKRTLRRRVGVGTIPKRI